MSRPRTQAQVEASAQKLLENHLVDGPPVDVEWLAEVLGAEIRRRPNSPDIAGLLFTDPETGTTVMGVNADDPHVRQRFTIAHEIGHLHLHPRTDTFWVDRSYRASKDHPHFGDAAEEREANWFAAELLMPRAMIKPVAEELLSTRWMTDEALIEALAARFRVSRQAMGYRLLNLGLVNGL